MTKINHVENVYCKKINCQTWQKLSNVAIFAKFSFFDHILRFSNMPNLSKKANVFRIWQILLNWIFLQCISRKNLLHYLDVQLHYSWNGLFYHENVGKVFRNCNKSFFLKEHTILVRKNMKNKVDQYFGLNSFMKKFC